MKAPILEISYLIASVSFVIGLKRMSNAKTARNGNLLAAAGMTIAILATIILHEGPVPPLIYGLIGLALLLFVMNSLFHVFLSLLLVKLKLKSSF